jgi:dienelactone hydrolase
MVSAEAIRGAWTAAVAEHGAVTTTGSPVSEPAGPGIVLVRIPVTFERGQLTILVSISDGGWLTGIELAPASAAQPVAAWEPPSYVDPETFDEQDVTLGSGPLAVPGTLSRPRRSGSAPAVVLLAGSGPNDRDETIGRNRPFKDLAGGLASNGIAVLRFDKVTYAHGDRLAAAADFTVFDEYVPDALAAIHLLRQDPGIDATRIFVLGHSLGGTVAPRVAVAEPSVAGLIILAGGAQPLHWAAVRQIRYLASLSPAAAAAESTVTAMTEAAEKVDSPDLSPTTPASELPFGVPAPYWLSVRDYHPVEVAATLATPIFILQGGRDYQATVADDLSLWKAGLADRAGVTIRTYDADNYFFFPGSGPSTPAEYEPVQHMDPAVITDIAGWLDSVDPTGRRGAV